MTVAMGCLWSKGKTEWMIAVFAILLERLSLSKKRIDIIRVFYGRGFVKFILNGGHPNVKKNTPPTAPRHN